MRFGRPGYLIRPTPLKLSRLAAPSLRLGSPGWRLASRLDCPSLHCPLAHAHTHRTGRSLPSAVHLCRASVTRWAPARLSGPLAAPLGWVLKIHSRRRLLSLAEFAAAPPLCTLPSLSCSRFRPHHGHRRATCRVIVRMAWAAAKRHILVCLSLSLGLSRVTSVASLPCLEQSGSCPRSAGETMARPSPGPPG